MRNELGKLLGDFILFRLYIMGKFRKRKTLRKRNTFRKLFRGGGFISSQLKKLAIALGAREQIPTEKEAQEAIVELIYDLSKQPEDNIPDLETKINAAEILEAAITSSGFTDAFRIYALNLAKRENNLERLKEKKSDMSRKEKRRAPTGRQPGMFDVEETGKPIISGGKKSRRKRRKKSRAKRRRTRR